VGYHFAVVLGGVHNDGGSTLVCGENGYVGDFTEVGEGSGCLSGDVGCGGFGVAENVCDCVAKVGGGCCVGTDAGSSLFGGGDEFDCGDAFGGRAKCEAFG
jgi:hypothetical protein